VVQEVQRFWGGVLPLIGFWVQRFRGGVSIFDFGIYDLRFLCISFYLMHNLTAILSLLFYAYF
jgi:hypothetical protein